MRGFGSQGEKARADDGADAQRHQIHRAECALQLMLAALTFAKDAGDGFGCEKAHAFSLSDFPAAMTPAAGMHRAVGTG